MTKRELNKYIKQNPAIYDKIVGNLTSDEKKMLEKFELNIDFTDIFFRESSALEKAFFGYFSKEELPDIIKYAIKAFNEEMKDRYKYSKIKKTFEIEHVDKNSEECKRSFEVLKEATQDYQKVELDELEILKYKIELDYGDSKATEISYTFLPLTSATKFDKEYVSAFFYGYPEGVAIRDSQNIINKIFIANDITDEKMAINPLFSQYVKAYAILKGNGFTIEDMMKISNTELKEYLYVNNNTEKTKEFLLDNVDNFFVNLVPAETNSFDMDIFRKFESKDNKKKVEKAIENGFNIYEATKGEKGVSKVFESLIKYKKEEAFNLIEKFNSELYDIIGERVEQATGTKNIAHISDTLENINLNEDEEIKENLKSKLKSIFELSSMETNDIDFNEFNMHYIESKLLENSTGIIKSKEKFKGKTISFENNTVIKDRKSLKKLMATKIVENFLGSVISSEQKSGFYKFENRMIRSELVKRYLEKGEEVIKFCSPTTREAVEEIGSFLLENNKKMLKSRYNLLIINPENENRVIEMLKTYINERYSSTNLSDDLFFETMLSKYENVINIKMDLERTVKQDREYASLVTNKQNIKKETYEHMTRTPFLKLFDKVEFDNSVKFSNMKNVRSDDAVIEKYEGQVNALEPIFEALDLKGGEIKFRKLGRLNANGCYLPSKDIMAIDVNNFNSMRSFMHELGHKIDYSLNRISLSKDFREIKRLYTKAYNECQKENPMMRRKADYYKTPDEVFARCFEYYMFKKGLISPFLKDESDFTHKSGYVFDKLLKKEQKQIVDFMETKLGLSETILKCNEITVKNHKEIDVPTLFGRQNQKNLDPKYIEKSKRFEKIDEISPEEKYPELFGRKKNTTVIEEKGDELQTFSEIRMFEPTLLPKETLENEETVENNNSKTNQKKHYNLKLF